MKKILALVAALFLGMLALAGPAAATGDGPSAENKKVEFCHATGSESNPYTFNETSVMAFYNSGHIDHEGDIWEAFSYTDKKGNVVNVPAQGDTSLLAFEDCQKPKVDEEIAVPAVNSVDKCEQADDTVTPVRDDTKYTTVVGPRVGDAVTVTFTALDGFTFPNGEKVVKVTVNFPNNDDCDLPETGGEATYNTALGGAALAGVILLGGVMLLTRRKTA